MGLFVVSQTLCNMDVFPAFALPMIRTRNWTFGIRRRGCCAPTGAISEEESVGKTVEEESIEALAEATLEDGVDRY